MPRKIVILGASGLLGTYLDRVHKNDHCLGTCFSRNAPGLHRLDLTDRSSTAGLIQDFKPDIVYLPAAITTPSLCQSDPDLARAVNAKPAAFLSELSLETGFRLVFLSSDLVFDGKKGNYLEDDPANPLSIYGRTKVEAEKAVLAGIERGADCLVVRTSLIIGQDRFGWTGNLAWMRGVIEKGEKIPLFTDEFRNPSGASELARGLALLAHGAAPGLYHLAGPERMSRFELGRIICAAMDWPESALRPTRLADLNLDPPRPADVSLNQDKARSVLGEEMVRPLAETLAQSVKAPG